MNIRAIIEAVARGETPEGYKKIDLGDGSFMFERREERESHGQTLGEILNEAIGRRDTPRRDDNEHGLDAFRQAIRGLIDRRTGVNAENIFINTFRPASQMTSEEIKHAQEQHDHVLEQQRQQEAMFERTLKQKTFDLGNATMCDLPRSVLKVLKMLLNDAGEAAEMGDIREFDTQIDAFNGLMLASGVKINCL